MAPVVSRWLTPGLFFLLTLASGVWLSRSGRPLKVLILTLHKVIALAAVILAGLAFYSALRSVDVRGLGVALAVLTALGVAALFASGALLSREKTVQRGLLALHQIVPALACLSTAAAIYFLAGGR